MYSFTHINKVFQKMENLKKYCLKSSILISITNKKMHTYNKKALIY